MPNIFKNFLRPKAEAYVFQPARELVVEEPPPPEELPEPEPESVSEPDIVPDAEPLEDAEPVPEPPVQEDPFAFARVQAEALMRDAEREAEAYKEQAMRKLEAELEEHRKAAREEGYSRGYAEGMADAMREAKTERERLAAEQIKSVEKFLTAAARERDRLFDENREEMKELAIAIAEKIIQVSLKNSGDIILRMVETATDTHKRCEWAHIYVADCDVRGKAYTVPELTAALSHIAERVRVIPMADDESGTCIVELPDVIFDASVSTQMGNIREVLSSAGPD